MVQRFTGKISQKSALWWFNTVNLAVSRILRNFTCPWLPQSLAFELCVLLYLWCVLYVCRDSFLCVWLVPTCAMTHSYVWHDVFVCVTWFIRKCDMTHSYVWYDSFICVTCLIYMCDITHSFVCHDTFICMTWRVTNLWLVPTWPWLIPICAMIHFSSVPWLILMCAMTHMYLPKASKISGPVVRSCMAGDISQK